MNYSFYTALFTSIHQVKSPINYGIDNGFEWFLICFVYLIALFLSYAYLNASKKSVFSADRHSNLHRFYMPWGIMIE